MVSLYPLADEMHPRQSMKAGHPRSLPALAAPALLAGLIFVVAAGAQQPVSSRPLAARGLTLIAPDVTPVARPATADTGRIGPGDALSISIFERTDEAQLRYRAGDRLRIGMAEDPRVAFEGEIPGSGKITLRFLGEFQAAGLTQSQCAAALEAALTCELYKHATITVQTIDRRNTQRLIAQVVVPESGLIEIPRLGNVPALSRTPAELGAAIAEGLNRQAYQQAGVEVGVTQRAPGSVVVYGAVDRPGVVRLPDVGELTILQLIAMVGGLTGWARPEGTYIRRVEPKTGERVTLPMDLAKALADPSGAQDVAIKPNDMVFVPSGNFRSTDILGTKPIEIIVVGEVGTPGIVSFAPGESRTLLRALLKAGGFGRFAKKDKVRLIRLNEKNERSVTVIDASAILDEGFLNKDVELLPGDMLIVGEKLFSW